MFSLHFQITISGFFVSTTCVFYLYSESKSSPPHASILGCILSFLRGDGAHKKIWNTANSLSKVRSVPKVRVPSKGSFINHMTQNFENFELPPPRKKCHVAQYSLINSLTIKFPMTFFQNLRAALRAGAASVCLLSMTFLLGASRLGFFVSLRLTDAFGGIEISFLLGAPLWAALTK